MFHVEHMKIWNFKTFFALLSVYGLVSCTKADPEAYRSDPILQDYTAQQAATHSMLESLNKQIEGAKKDMASSVPQSGQYAAHRKKMNELEAKADKLVQQLQFWKMRIESRAKEAQAEYLVAFKNKKEWPNKEKTESYFTEKRLRQAKMQWDQKERIQEYQKSTQKKTNTGH